MKPNVQKEINDLKRMVTGWYNFYLGCADGHEYDQVHVEEFDEVVDQQLSPYLQRLKECKHVDKKELGDFYGWLGEMHLDLSEAISQVEPKPQEDPIVTLLKNLELTEGQKKAIFDYISHCQAG